MGEGEGNEMCCQHCEQVAEMSTNIVDLRVGDAEIKGNVNLLLDASKRIEDGMVTQHEFRPVRLVVYGAVTMVSAGFIAFLGKIAWGLR